MTQENDSFLENSLLFIHMLRHAGLSVSLHQSMDFVQALTLIDIGDREQVFHAARCLLVTRQEHLRLFETLFNRFWRRQQNIPSGRRTNTRRRKNQIPKEGLASLMALKSKDDVQVVETPDQTKIYSDLEVIQRKAFADMTPDELEAIRNLMQRLQWKVSQRQTRRYIPDMKGTMLHRRRVMRSAVRYGGVPLYLAWQRRKVKQRPIVLIADISGSMENYSRLILQFFYSVSHSLKNVECFVFGTRLTRITPQLKLKNIDLALQEASIEVVDWSGGTRIGESLRRFNQEWSRRVLRRGAVVLIVSDGWDRGDSDVLKREMRYLKHRSYRVIWLNPHLGQADYQPRVEGMAAALPYIDHFMPCHNLRSLETFGHLLANLDKFSIPAV